MISTNISRTDKHNFSLSRNSNIFTFRHELQLWFWLNKLTDKPVNILDCGSPDGCSCLYFKLNIALCSGSLIDSCSQTDNTFSNQYDVIYYNNDYIDFRKSLKPNGLVILGNQKEGVANLEGLYTIYQKTITVLKAKNE